MCHFLCASYFIYAGTGARIENMKSRIDEDGVYWEQYASKAIYVQYVRERAG